MSMTHKFGIVIVGGGILGSALAALVAAAKIEPLVLRRPDIIAPNCDTLRNQGWLQSGVMYPIAHFGNNEDAYQSFAGKTYAAGRQLLRMCGLQTPESDAILGVSDPKRIQEFLRKRELLRLSDHEFGQYGQSEAKDLMGEHFVEGAVYFRLPDGPFNEAAVLRHFRDSAIQEGAHFVEVERPVQLQRLSDEVRIIFGEDQELTVPTVVVTAGVGSFDLMQQCGCPLDGVLQRTPLVVGDAPTMPASIVIDLDRGFSAVRHDRGQMSSPAVVMGTRTKTRHEGMPHRVISKPEMTEFAEGVPPSFQRSMATGRVTAGYEVLPNKTTGVTGYQPWIKNDGPLIFGSPGRATVSGLAALDLFAILRKRWRSKQQRRTTPVDISTCSPWNDTIDMHYMSPPYSFNDVEV